MTLRRYVATVVVAVALLQAAWIAVVPPFRGSDEIDHSYRAAAVAHGQWVAPRWASEGRGWLVAVPPQLVSAASWQCRSLDYMGPQNCEPVRIRDDGLAVVASSAAAYEPVFYALIGYPSLAFEGAQSFYAMRVFGAVLCLFFVGAAAVALFRAGVGRYAALYLPITMSPVAIFSTALVAPNGLEMSAALALWAALLALGSEVLAREHEGSIIWIAIAGAVAVAGLRGLGPHFTVLICVMSIAFGGRTARERLRRHPLLVSLGASAALLTGAGQVLWVRYDASLAIGSPSSFTTVDASALAELGRYWWIPSSVIVWPLQMIAAFPTRLESAPPAVYALFTLLFIGAIALGTFVATRRQRVVMVLLLIGVVVMPFILTLATYDSRGLIWQGRYGLPLAFGAPLMACMCLTTWTPPRWGWVSAGTAALLIPAHALGLVWVLTREELRSASASDASWHDPSPVLVFGVVVVACSLFAWLSLKTESLRA